MDDEIMQTVESLLGKDVKIVDCQKTSSVQEEEILLINGIRVTLDGDDGNAIKTALMTGKIPSCELLNQLLCQAGILRQPVQLETSLSVKSSTLTKEEVTVAREGVILDERTSEVQEDNYYTSLCTEIWNPINKSDNNSNKNDNVTTTTAKTEGTEAAVVVGSNSNREIKQKHNLREEIILEESTVGSAEKLIHNYPQHSQDQNINKISGNQRYKIQLPSSSSLATATAAAVGTVVTLLKASSGVESELLKKDLANNCNDDEDCNRKTLKLSGAGCEYPLIKMKTENNILSKMNNQGNNLSLSSSPSFMSSTSSSSVAAAAAVTTTTTTTGVVSALRSAGAIMKNISNNKDEKEGNLNLLTSDEMKNSNLSCDSGLMTGEYCYSCLSSTNIHHQCDDRNHSHNNYSQNQNQHQHHHNHNHYYHHHNQHNNHHNRINNSSIDDTGTGTDENSLSSSYYDILSSDEADFIVNNNNNNNNNKSATKLTNSNSTSSSSCNNFNKDTSSSGHQFPPFEGKVMNSSSSIITIPDICSEILQKNNYLELSEDQTVMPTIFDTMTISSQQSFKNSTNKKVPPQSPTSTTQPTIPPFVVDLRDSNIIGKVSSDVGLIKQQTCTTAGAAGDNINKNSKDLKEITNTIENNMQEKQNKKTTITGRCEINNVERNNDDESDDLSLVYRDGNLISGPLDALIQHMVPTSDYYPDKSYIFAFLLSSRLFISPHELLKKISQLCDEQQNFTKMASLYEMKSLKAQSTSSSSSLPSSQSQRQQQALPLAAAAQITGGGSDHQQIYKIHKHKYEKLCKFTKNLIQLLAEWIGTFPYDFRDERLMHNIKLLTKNCINIDHNLKSEVSAMLQELLNRLSVVEKYEEFLQSIARYSNDNFTTNLQSSGGDTVTVTSSTVAGGTAAAATATSASSSLVITTSSSLSSSSSSSATNNTGNSGGSNGNTNSSITFTIGNNRSSNAANASGIIVNNNNNSSILNAGASGNGDSNNSSIIIIPGMNNSNKHNEQQHNQLIYGGISGIVSGNSSQSQVLPPSMSFFLSNISSSIELAELCPNPTILAFQLTHIELERLSYIGPEEFVQAFVKENSSQMMVKHQHNSNDADVKRTGNLESYVQWFNRLSYIVATEVVKHFKKKQRVKVIEYWIETARECFNIGNFNSLMAIIAGLNMSSISRLKKTWAKVQLAKFSVLEHQMDPSSNFISYRSTLKAAMWRSAGATDERERIVIPFFSLLIKDLYFLNEGCSNRLPNGHINFEKFWQLAKQVTEFITWKQVNCPFEKLPKVIMFLQTNHILNENTLAMASFECEPPENHEKDRYKSLKSEQQQTAAVTTTIK